MEGRSPQAPPGPALLQVVVDGQQAEVFFAVVIDRGEDRLLEADLLAPLEF